ncbi:MAG: secondary thiamine-phosphate synthase enzyme YjbQ [bacterium]
MKILQKTITLSPHKRGFHLVTDEIEKQLPELKKFKAGFAHIFIKHTSAGLTINENADPTVQSDLNTFFDRLVPENANLYQHTAEGLDDMTSHIKTSLTGSSVTVPITDGRFNLGTWQGIYLCEFRNGIRSRKVIFTIIGVEYDEK